MTTAKENYKHWQLNTDTNDILWLTLDRQDERVNSLNQEVLFELETILDSLKSSTHKGLILHSGKSTGFIVGADISQFKELNDAAEATDLIKRGQNIFAKLENLSMPTLALINGFCLGGGLELSLACKYRIAADNDRTRLGLPEVKLGIHPGWGGCVRLPALVGAFSAMDIILSGRMLRAKQAYKMGIINEAVPDRLLNKVAIHYILKQPQPKKLPWHKKLSNANGIRTMLAPIFRRQLNKKVNEKHYPAPFAVVDNWEKVGCQGQVAYDTEANSIGQLLVSSTSKNLVRVFFLQDMLKSFGKKSKNPVQHVHVVGAGTMGGDIAAWCAFKGLKVTLQDREPLLIAGAMKRAFSLAKKRLKANHLVKGMLDRIIPDHNAQGLGQADLIIEAITEKLEVKQSFFKEVEKLAKKDAILATNTSTIPLEEIASALHSPERLVGIHYFNPVAKMPLVEVVKSKFTADEVMERATSFVKQIDKLPLPVKSSPGFLVNRILLPYMMEALIIMKEGVPGALIDKAALEFGMPMGPIELADTVGLDVCLAATEKLSETLSIEVPKELRDYVSRGDLGRKTNKGFYTYKNGKRQGGDNMNNVSTIPKDVQDRLILRLLNEAVACLREGIVPDPDALDAGCIFGFGFAPFRGGPMHYAKSQGQEKLLQQLSQLASRYGERFNHDKGWDSGKVA